jgi:hypothetical protein
MDLRISRRNRARIENDSIKNFIETLLTTLAGLLLPTGGETVANSGQKANNRVT